MIEALRRTTLGTAAVAALALGAATTTGEALARPGVPPKLCVRYVCRTIAADAKVRVYQATPRHPGREPPFTRTFARWMPSRRVIPLGDGVGPDGPAEGPGLAKLALAGRFVGYAMVLSAERYPGFGYSEAMYRLNVQTGKRETIPSIGADGSQFGPMAGGIEDVAVTPAGSVAWLMGGPYANLLKPVLGPPPVPEDAQAVLVAAPHSTEARALAVSTAIEPGSLAAVVGQVYWSEAEQARGAKIA